MKKPVCILLQFLFWITTFAQAAETVNNPSVGDSTKATEAVGGVVQRLNTAAACSVTVVVEPPGLKPGNYMLKVTLVPEEQTCKEKRKMKVIDPGELVVTEKVNRKPVIPDSVKAIKVKEHKRNQLVRRVIFGGLAAGTFCGGLYFNNKAADAADEYKSYKGRDSATHDAHWDLYQTERKRRNICYGFAGAFAAGFAVSIPF